MFDICECYSNYGLANKNSANIIKMNKMSKWNEEQIIL